MNFRFSTAAVSVCCFVVVTICNDLSAQVQGVALENLPPTSRASRTQTPPVVDGKLDEEVWASPPTVSGFVQHEPFEGQPPTENTELRIVYDDDAIYIGARMYDSRPDEIRFGENRRDARLENADALLIALDTFRDKQNAYVFGTTAAGIEYDGQVTNDGQGGLTTARRLQAGPGIGGGFNLNWDGSWEVATSIDDLGWCAEFRIPFSTLRYGGAGEQIWGLNVSRTVRRLNEEVFWAPVPRQHKLYRVSQAGTLEGVEAPARHPVHVTRYFLSSGHRDFDAATPTDWKAEFGADAKIGLTTGLNLDLTYNTDFAQVEVDERQTNLTRFSLFFPEKRPFFLENAGLFAVGIPRAGSDLGMDLFYSRRIGIGEGGLQVPILGGGRLTGNTGGVNVGVLSIQTEAVGDVIPANNYSVGRAIKELPNRSQIGAMVISRLNTDSTADYNVTYAIDTRLGVGESINLDAHFARTETPGLGGRQHGLGVTAAYRTRFWDISLQYREIGEDFNPEVGFLPRSDYRVVIGRLERKIRVPQISWLRELTPHIVFRDWYGFDGFQQTRYIHIDNAMMLEDGGFLSTVVNVRREGLQEPFEIVDGLFIPTSTYDFVEGSLRYNTDPSKVLSLTSEVTAGGFFSGHRKSASATLTNRMGSTWTAAFRVGYDNVDLAEGSFDNTLVSLRVAYAFTPRMYLQSLVQYDNVTDDVSANVRFGWLNTAGTGLFLVFNEVERTLSPMGPRDRAFFVKFTRQLSLAD